MSNPTIFNNLVAKFTKGGDLTASQQSELDAIKLSGDINPDSTFWLHFLPLYFLMARRDDERINTAAMVDGVERIGKSKGINQHALADAIAARLAETINEIAPNTDPVVLARAVAKAAVPAIQQAVEDATANAVQQPKVDLAPLQISIKEVLQQMQGKMVEAGRDAIFNRHIAIMAVAGILLGIAGTWWGGHTSDLQWQAANQQAQNDNKELKAELKLSLDRSGRKLVHQ